MGAVRGAIGALAAAVLLSLLAFAPAASADLTVCAAGMSAGQCKEPQGLEVDTEDALLYVADRGNNRVDVFNAATGAFLRAFGWGVASGAPALEVCTAVCLAGLPGGGAGQLAGLTGVAVDNDSTSPDQHDVYTFESSNARVTRFDPAGGFILTFGGKVNKTKVEAGAPAEEQNICPVDPGDVCQAGTVGSTPGFFRSNAKIDVGPGGVVHVADNTGGNIRVQKFDSDAQAAGECGALPPGGFGGSMKGFAVDAAGNLYAASDGSGAVRKYTSGCALLEPPSPLNPSFNINTLALGAAGHVFVGDSTGVTTGGETAVYEYAPGGTLVRVHYGNGSVLSRPIALAPFVGANGDIFASEQGGSGRVVHFALPPLGPVVHPDPKFTEAFPVSNTKATLSALVNPEGKATKLHFEYVDDATYQVSGFDEALRWPPNEADDPTVGAGDFKLAKGSLVAGCLNPVVEAGEPGNTCLTPETEYHFRAIATNADAPTGQPGPEGDPFTTEPPLAIIETYATAVGTDTAKLHATVNPLGIPTTGHFEYVEEATYQEDVAQLGAGHGFDHAKTTAAIDFGAGNAPSLRNILVSSLEPGTAYRYRLLAFDPLIEETPIASAEHAFVSYPLPSAGKIDCPNQTLRSGLSAKLPDCRAYEMVSPLEKGNADVVGLFGLANGIDGSPPSRIDQATPQGGEFTYSSFRSFGDAQSSHWSSQYFARREGTGWSSRSINPPRNVPSLYDHLGKEVPFKAFSEDLCSAWLLQDSDLPLAPGAPSGVGNLYRRDNCGAGEGTYELLTTVAPSEPAPGFHKDIDGTSSLYLLATAGFSEDAGISVFRAPAKLTPDASEEDIFQVYLHEQGAPSPALHLVSVLPSGVAANTHAAAGSVSGSPPADFRSETVARAVAADGSRIFWSAEANEPSLPVHNGATGGNAGRLFVRLNPTEEQSAVNGSDECTEAAKACTVQISTDASVFHAANPAATKAIYSEGSDLYELDVDKAAAYEAGGASPIAGEVLGVVGASEDASRVYLVSEEDLDGTGGAQAGEPNLYLHEAGAPIEFIATLTGGTSGDERVYAGRPLDRRSRVSEDGLHAVFMSRAPLTSYDNTHAGSPVPCGELGGICDAEVFLYDAAEEKLRCVSCNPSGGRPLGARNFSANPSFPDWVIARIPGWETQWQPSRLLSADGRRVFFESFEPLVLRDTNGKKDVYEWEQAASSEECLEGIGGELFVAASEGCLSLISSGESEGDSEFLDASASGSDVFFATASSLLPQDYGLVDIYDAREGGGFPAPLPPPLPCEGEACQSPPPPPEDPTPASSVFEGQGNLKEVAKLRKRSCPKGKRKARRAGKTRCVAKHKKRSEHRRRRVAR